MTREAVARILLVEDEEALAEGLRVNLHRKQYDVDVANDGRTGLAFAAEVDTEATVLANDDGLRRVMTNLVENAVRFSHKGGEIRCRVADTGHAVRIEVEDDGVGIPRHELTKIFDRFYQIGREISGRRGGTGLGLAIVASLVKEMNGDVKAMTIDGKPGTRFVITLPLAESRS